MPLVCCHLFYHSSITSRMPYAIKYFSESLFSSFSGSHIQWKKWVRDKSNDDTGTKEDRHCLFCWTHYFCSNHRNNETYKKKWGILRHFLLLLLLSSMGNCFSLLILSNNPYPPPVSPSNPPFNLAAFHLSLPSVTLIIHVTVQRLGWKVCVHVHTLFYDYAFIFKVIVSFENKNCHAFCR